MSIEQLELAALEVLSNNTLDVIAIYTENFIPVLTGTKKMSLTVDNRSKLARQPVESGASIIDHKTILPVEIRLNLFFDSMRYRIDYPQIKQFYDNSDSLIIQTRSGIYKNMYIESLPHNESPGRYDTLMMSLSMVEVNFIVPEFEEVPQDPKNTATKDAGSVQASEAMLPEEDQGSSFTQLTGVGEVYKG